MDLFTAMKLKLNFASVEHARQDPLLLHENTTTSEGNAVPRSEEELPHVKAGRQAEEKFLSSMLNVSGVDRVALFPGLRVPAWAKHKDQTKTTKEGFEIVPLPKNSSRSVARGEIDLVLVSQKGIYVLEIKNWSGTLSADSMKSSHWYQHRRDGSVVIHQNAVELTSEKATNLHLHLNREGCEMPASAVLSQVVFVNPRMEIDPIIKQTGKIIEAKDLAKFLASFGRSPLTETKDRWLPNWYTGCNVSSSLVEKAQHVLRYTVGTWDVLTLRDGGRLIGDLKDIVVRDQPSKSKVKVMEAINKLGGRGATARLAFEPSAFESPLQWLSNQLFGWGGATFNVVLIPRDAVQAHPDTNYADVISHTLRAFMDDALANIMPRKIAANVSGGETVLFQCCGQKEPRHVKVSEVSEVILSRV